MTSKGNDKKTFNQNPSEKKNHFGPNTSTRIFIIFWFQKAQVFLAASDQKSTSFFGQPLNKIKTQTNVTKKTMTPPYQKRWCSWCLWQHQQSSTGNTTAKTCQ